ncbi:putative MFS family arabinose efflux permease [Nitrobacteraceae bacterium AZCC 2161]
MSAALNQAINKYSMPDERLPVFRQGTIQVMAIACGVMVGNVYLCQPLLAQMAQDLGVSEQTSSLVAFATQIGYAFGILMVVPLADKADPAKLMRWLLAITAFGLGSAAFAPSVSWLLLACAIFAPLTVVPQILIPLSTSLVSPHARGQVVGKLSAGVVIGILLSRTISGAVAQATGSWRASYLLAAALTTILWFVLPPFMPQNRVRNTGRYRDLLASLPAMLRHRPLLLSVGINFFVFGAFSAFWSTLVFHVSTPEFGFGPAAAGLFGLWGIPGALIATIAGRLTDRLGPARVNVFALLAAASGMLVAGTWGTASITGMVASVNLLDLGMQSGQIANQTRIFGLGDAIRGRVNTIYMTATFLGGAAGAAEGAAAWTHAGWSGVCVLGGSLIAVAAGIFLCSKIFSRKIHL